MHIGILAAMPEEIGPIINDLKKIKKEEFGDLVVYSGIYEIQDKEVYISLAWSGWGKVSAARATTRLISSTFNDEKVNLIFFTGLAGAAKENLKQWDIIVADSVIQHDMDPRPFYDQYVVPSINKDIITTNPSLSESLFKGLKEISESGMLSKFRNVHKGLIATGDKFISDKNEIKRLTFEMPLLKAVEMEGAAFAQVCYQEKTQWLILRVISDGADDNAHNDFDAFLKDYKCYSSELIKIFLKLVIDNF